MKALANLLNLIATPSTPAASAAGSISLFARKRAGRVLLNYIGPAGIDSAFQPALFGNQVYMWSPSNSTTVSIAFGTTWTARNTTGAQSTPTKATANFLTQMARALFSSTAAANTCAGIQSTQTVAVRGNAANIGGFYFFARFGVETLSGTGQQIIVGLTAGLNGVLAGEPSALLNSIALTKDSGETTWQLLTRDGSGTVTKYNTGETVTAGRVYDLHIFCKPNDTKVTIRLVRLNDNTVIMDDVELSTTLPVATTFMYAHAHLRNTGTAINALALNRIYVETDV